MHPMAGPGHRRNRVHRGAKMKDVFFCTFFYSQFYINTINLKCYTKSDHPTKTTIVLLSSVRLMIFPRTAALPLAHIRDLFHILKTTIFNNFKINILITGCFTTSTIEMTYDLCFTAYSNCSAVKPFKPVQFLLMIFSSFMTEVILSETSHRCCVSNSAPSRNKSSDM